LEERNGGQRPCGIDTERGAPRRWGKTENQEANSIGKEGLSLELPFFQKHNFDLQRRRCKEE